MVERLVTSVAAMHELAAEVAGTVHGGELLLLVGELGAGKTTFVQGLGIALGVQEMITSPTFTVMSEHAVSHRDIKQLIHLDLYRLLSPAANTDPAVLDALSQATQLDRVTVIEWPDRLTVPPSGRTIHFQHAEQDSHRIVVLDAAN